MTDTPKLKLVFSPPDPDAPGYLKRQRLALELFDSYKGNPSVDTVDKLVDFLLPFVIEPKTKTKAREALWDASQNQIQQMITVVVGGSDEGEENPT